MTIHHATLKKATAMGVVLTEKNGHVLAHWPKLNQRLMRSSAKEALDEMEALIDMKLNFKSFKLAPPTEAGRFVISLKGEEIGSANSIRDAFRAAKEAWREMQADAEEEGEEIDPDEDEEEGAISGSVVPEKYKRLYAERGNPSCCGDWLAEALNEIVLDGDGKLDVGQLVTVSEANNVQCRAYIPNGEGTPGWQGRMRMTVRNMLRGKIALSGTLVVPGGRDRKAPEDWCDRNMPKIKAPPKKKAA